MSTISVYCLVRTWNKAEAIRAVNSFLEASLEKEFYDGFKVLEGGTQALSVIPDSYFAGIRAASQRLLQRFRVEAEKAWKSGNRTGEAGALRHASDLLFENMCQAMPWFNIEGGDFSMPFDKRGWWAVMVEFYY